MQNYFLQWQISALLLLALQLGSAEPAPQWWTEAEFDLLSRVVMAEAGGTGSDEAMQGVAAVVINRMTSYPEQFGATIHDVIYRPGQYACLGALPSTVASEEAKENTLIALRGEDDFPDDVVWQSGVPLAAWGKSVKIYKVLDTYPSNIYFCHYGGD